MKYLILLITFNVYANYEVKEFDKYCANGCRFSTREMCEQWLQAKHPSKDKSLCEDITSVIQAEEAEKAQRAADKIQAKGLENIKWSDLTTTQRNKLIKFLIYEVTK